MAFSSRRALIHLLTCLAFLALPILFSPDLGQPGRMLHSPGFLKDFAGYSLSVLFFYLNFYVLVPKLYFRQRHLWFALAAICAFVLLSVLPEWLIGGQPPPGGQPFAVPGQPAPFSFHDIRQTALRFSIAFLISWLWQINNRWRLSEQEKTTAELAFLRAQINPHFLFNTLNSIYALALTRSEQTPAAVAKLSAMMRYVTNEANRDTVGLDKELDYIRNYIDLQKIRFGDTIRLSYTESGEAAGRRIAPLLLIPFVENAFKYGISPEEDSEIRISACCTVDQFELRVSNNKVRIQAGKELSNGVGLHNTHNRLEHLYPGRYRMQVENLPERYSVFLQLDLS